MLDKTQRLASPSRAWAGVRASGESGGWAGGRPPLIRAISLPRGFTNALFILGAHLGARIARHQKLGLRPSHPTHPKSRSAGVLARRHFLISKRSDLFSVVVWGQVRGYRPAFKLWPHLRLRTPGRNKRSALARSQLGPGGFRIPSSISGKR